MKHAVRQHGRRRELGDGPGVSESRDEGETWSGLELGRHVHALALSPDGLTLYAATDRGVWAR